ncbi:MAG: DUF3078 domain-containing protein [Bacteroidetes bacterium]|jgi:hypothetical protein|nr:DUF3078 domain-containing protein [Bacteroidota bacterium]
MKRTLLASIVGLCLFLPTLAAAQEAPPDSARAWKTDLVGKLSASQAGYQNWQEGGLNTLAFTVGASGAANRTTGRWQQTYDGRLAFGLIKQDTLDFRKADDIIRLGAALKYIGNGFFRTFKPTVAITARTQFASGFNYDENPFEGEEDTPAKVSELLSPGTFTQSLGLTYEPTPWFRQRLGVSAKETMVLAEKLRPLYGVDPADPVRYEVGMESISELDKEVIPNVRWQSKLGLFAAFNQADVPDLLWENLVIMSVNKYLSVNFEFVTLYDRDISDALQLKEVLSLGVSVTLL